MYFLSAVTLAYRVGLSSARTLGLAFLGRTFKKNLNNILIIIKPLIKS